jgi:hypothetical protein
MSSKLIPLMRTRDTAVSVPTPLDRLPEGAWDVQFWRSWLQHNANPHRSACGLMSWGTVFGLALTVVVGASFWTGVGFLVARLWK